MIKMPWTSHAFRIFQRQPGTMFRKKLSNLPSTIKVEEEILPHYHANRFYPAQIGETFVGKYQVVGKLGYGGCSTVWLARDISRHVDYR